MRMQVITYHNKNNNGEVGYYEFIFLSYFPWPIFGPKYQFILRRTPYLRSLFEMVFSKVNSPKQELLFRKIQARLYT